MSSSAALLALAWIAIVLLYLAMARLMVEMQSLRSTVSRSGLRQSDIDVTLRGWLPPLPSASIRLVLVVDDDCEFCRQLAQLAHERCDERIYALLVYKDPNTWKPYAARDSVLVDSAAWASFAPLAAPIMVHVDQSGGVTHVYPPPNLAAADIRLAEWNLRKEKEIEST